uniref:Uncharacterized mitochondrial protein AtMg00810-like n=1 Tax=Nicotiana tabacum TaxID=4097 RepID=A0A1S4BPA2_TOBAC|nr:PREDICTED: uncharacterized mitochondrial protein AtMg00810-like [Nicotiana tabacum]
MIFDAGLAGSKPKDTPMKQNLKLTSTEFDTCTDTSKGDELLEDKGSYQLLIGKLLYLTITRPDISYTVQSLSQFMHAPKKSHYEAALYVVRYIKKQLRLGLLMSSDSNEEIEAFCDSDWASCPMSRKSVTGYCVKLGISTISRKAKKQHIVSRSSAETEYRSMAHTIAELVWLKCLLEELSVNLKLPMKLFYDNKAVLQIAANPMYHERIKHIEIDCHSIREKIQKGLIKSSYIPSQEQPADVLTKALGHQQHAALISKMEMKDIFSFST